MTKYKSPLSAADAEAILTALDEGKELEEIVEPELVEPIQGWLEECTRIGKMRRSRD